MADNNELQEVMDEAGLRHLWAGLKERLALKNHTHSAADVGAAEASDLTSHTDNKNNPHGVTAAQAGAVPTSRTVNSKALSANITLSAGDVGAVAKNEDVSIQKSGVAYESIFGQGTRNALLRVRNVAGDSSNQRTIAVFDSTQRPDLATAIRFYDVADGTEAIYSLFGEHNLDLLATSLGAAKIATGSYTGTGTTGTTAQVTINCGFRPKIVFLYVKTEKATSVQYKFAVLIDGYAFKGFEGHSGSIQTGFSYLNVNYTDTGFELSGTPVNSWTQHIMNYSGTVYGYYAIG